MAGRGERVPKRRVIMAGAADSPATHARKPNIVRSSPAVWS